MNRNLKANERELVKVVAFFKRQSKKLIAEGKLGEEHGKVAEAVDRFIEQMESHAETRAIIMEQREDFKKIVKDSAVCPRCHTNDKLRRSGTEKNEKGWKCNRYRCRKCNIEFTWNRPNNPWDMIRYIEEVIGTLIVRLNDPSVPDTEKAQIQTGLTNMRANLEKLKPVIDAHDKEYDDINTKDVEMEKLIHDFKNSLLMERIKMDTWENKKGSRRI